MNEKDFLLYQNELQDLIRFIYERGDLINLGLGFTATNYIIKLIENDKP